MTKITVLAIDDPKGDHLAPLQRVPEFVKVVVSDQMDILEQVAPEADVIWAGQYAKLFKAVFPKATRVRWVHTYSAGIESFLSPEIMASAVMMTNARGVFKSALAEFVIAAALYFAKDLPRMMANQAAGSWATYDLEELRGKSLGIVGYGATGRATAQLAHPFGMTILGLRRRPALSQGDALLDRVFGTDGLLEMLALSDYIVLAMPGTPNTRKLIGEREIQAMKRNAVLINVGRGSSVEESPLIHALQENRIRGAALDVFEAEPLPAGSPFYSLKNVLLSPHIADHTPDWQTLTTQFFVENLERFVNGHPLENVVDKHAGY